MSRQQLLTAVTIITTLLKTTNAQACDSLRVEFAGSRDVTFVRDILLDLHTGEVNYLPWYSSDDYSVYWNSRCGVVSVTGCEDIHGDYESISDYVLQPEMCNGRALYKSSDDYYLYYRTSTDDWNIPPEVPVIRLIYFTRTAN